MVMPGRSYTYGSGYRYGFNGKENDNEVKGEGNQQDYGMRIYDPRLGRFLSVDPLTAKYPELTPYQFASNTPIQGTDFDGMEVYYAADGSLLGKVGTNTQVMVVNKEFVTYAPQTIADINRPPSASDFLSFSGQSLSKMVLADNSKAVGMTNAELNTRAFLTLLRRSEHDGEEPLAYNALFGGGTFTDKSYEENPKGYTDHPMKPVKKWGLTADAAGAYQILGKTWKNVIKPLNKPADFGPKEQDRAVLTLINEQEKYNTNKAGTLNDIKSGNIESAISKLKGTWTSLPGAKEQLIDMSQARDIFKESIRNELRGQSAIATQQGKLLPSNQ